MKKKEEKKKKKEERKEKTLEPLHPVQRLAEWNNTKICNSSLLHTFPHPLISPPKSVPSSPKWRREK